MTRFQPSDGEGSPPPAIYKWLISLPNANTFKLFRRIAELSHRKGNDAVKNHLVQFNQTIWLLLISNNTFSKEKLVSMTKKRLSLHFFKYFAYVQFLSYKNRWKILNIIQDQHLFVCWYIFWLMTGTRN